MTTDNMLSIIKSVPEDKFIYDKIIQTYIEPLYRERKLKTDIYMRITGEADYLRKRKRKRRETENVPDPKEIVQQNVNNNHSNAMGKRSSTTIHKPPKHLPVAYEKYSSQPNISSDPSIYSEKIIKLKEKNRNLEDKIDSLREEIQNLRDEGNSLRTRISKLAGEKLKSGNPNIVDLGDRYRATELGKHFAELYDNEWSDAFEEVNRILKDERKSIFVLYKTVTHAFETCTEKAIKQEERIRDIILDVEEGKITEYSVKRIENMHNRLVEPRKSVLHISSKNVAKNYIQGEFSEMVAGFDIKSPGQKLLRFAEKCAELCWCMSMCDPPMDMNASDINKPFDKNTYREYTRSTKDLRVPLIEFIVWPALYLNHGGSMVSKGVAQPYEKLSKAMKSKN